MQGKNKVQKICINLRKRAFEQQKIREKHKEDNSDAAKSKSRHEQQKIREKQRK